MKRLVLMLGLCTFSGMAQAAPLRVVALGDSLTAGYGLPTGADYASQLALALQKDGLDVVVENAGVSGDTTAGGAARLDRAIAGKMPPSLVIVALGGNDLLRGVDPATTENNLRGILQKLQRQKIPAMLFGMRTPYQLPPAYRQAFDGLYPKLAKEFDVPLYPFFLDGVVFNPALNLPDGVHPNQNGIAVMVTRTTPLVREALDD